MAGYDERCDTFSYGMLLWSLMHEVAVPPSSASRPPLSLSPDRAVYSDLITRCWQQDPGLRPSMQVVAAETIATAETSGLALWEPAASPATAPRPSPPALPLATQPLTPGSGMRSARGLRLDTDYRNPLSDGARLAPAPAYAFHTAQ